VDGSKQQQVNQWPDGHENGAKRTATTKLQSYTNLDSFSNMLGTFIAEAIT
jgi:hypothetical protein